MSEQPITSDNINAAHVILPVELTPKGLQIFTLDLDEFELIETGTKTKNGKPVAYVKYKVVK